MAKRRWPCCPSASSQSISRSDLRRAKTFSLNSWVLSEFIALTLATQLGPFDPFDGISFISIAMPRGGITWPVSSSNTSRAALIWLLSASPAQSGKHKAVVLTDAPPRHVKRPYAGTRQRATPRADRTSGGTGTRVTSPTPRPTRSGSRCRTPERPPFGNAMASSSR